MATSYTSKAMAHKSFVESSVQKLKDAQNVWMDVFGELFDIFVEHDLDPRLQADESTKHQHHKRAKRIAEGRGYPPVLRKRTMFLEIAAELKAAGYKSYGGINMRDAYNAYAKFRWAGVPDAAMRHLGMTNFRLAIAIVNHSEMRPRHQDVVDKIRAQGLRKTREEYGVK